METGITGKKKVIVTEEMTAQAMSSGTLPVYATPCMVALMEDTAKDSVAPYLEEGQGTVGTLVNVGHVSATPVGMEVTCETKLIQVDRKRLVFEVKAYDAAGVTGGARTSVLSLTMSGLCRRHRQRRKRTSET